VPDLDDGVRLVRAEGKLAVAVGVAVGKMTLEGGAPKTEMVDVIKSNPKAIQITPRRTQKGFG
jgi:hypothetical protein